MSQTGPSRKAAPEMFDDISGTYDLLNRILSLGQDIRWRKRLARSIPNNAERILDCATGTGDQLLAVLDKTPLCKQAYGIDPSGNMLIKAREKFHATPYGNKVEFFLGKAHELPFKEAYFDAVTMSFGIRNVEEVVPALKEMRRVTKTGGTLLLLEFSLPSSKFIRIGHKAYLKYIVPIIGRFLSKNDRAYRYLAETIETFPYGRSFCALLEQAGFSHCEAHPLSFGITTLYVAQAL